jgi:phosphatidylinositol-3-phosphatase
MTDAAPAAARREGSPRRGAAGAAAGSSLGAVARIRLVVLLVAGLVAGCGGAAAQSAPRFAAPSAVRPSASSHVAVIVMENHEFGSVIGSRAAPYTNRLARRYGLATASFGVRHPSLPNYLALTSGSTHGITSDCTGCSVAARNIADTVQAAGLSWKAYLEDLPRPCFTGASSGDYAKKHNPFAYYVDIASRPQRCRREVPFGRLSADLRRGRLPAYAFVAPNLCHDTHDCSVATGDRFLRRVVPSLLRGLGPHGFLVVTYDEGASDAGCCGGSAGGRIPTIVAGPDVRRGARDARPVDQYGVLRTIESALRLPLLGASADRGHGDLRALFKRAPHVR